MDFRVRSGRRELYLSRSWTDDADRLTGASVPDDIESPPNPRWPVGAENPVTSCDSEDVGELRSGGSDPSCD